VRSPAKFVLMVSLGTIPWFTGCSPLHTAAVKGDVEKLRTLIENGAYVDDRDPDGRTALHYAAQRGNKECVDLLLAKGANVNMKDNRFYAPLHHAAVGGSKDCVESLLKAGPVVDIRSVQVETVYRESYKYREVVSEPIGAYVSSFGVTPLYIAASLAWPEVVRVLIEHGANVNATADSANGWTPLLIAIYELQLSQFERKQAPVLLPAAQKISRAELCQRAEETVRVLVEKGADVNMAGENSLGFSISPLRMAINSKNREVVKLLLDHGANPNEMFDKDAISHSGRVADRTLLHRTVESSSPDIEIIRLLLDHGADPNTRSTYGSQKKTPLAVANDKKIKELLRQYGAKE
jgi:ankyrin repeat protein